MSLQPVHLRINDAATGEPTPVRLRVTDAAGNYYAPYGRAAEFATGVGENVGGNVLVVRDSWTYIDGTCEIAVPPGELTIQASKGPEYRPLRETVHLPAGKLALRFEIDRWIDQRGNGWYSGDTRAHFISPHAALLEAAAEDLAVVNLLACESVVASQSGKVYASVPNLLAFSGQKSCLEHDGHVVAVNTRNVHTVLGRLGLLHCHRVVYPLTFGGADHTDDWSLDDWCGQCHRKNGLVVWTDAFDPKAGHAGEALACLILGHVDALELDPGSPQRLRAWYKLLDAGLRVPLVGASAKDSNRTPLGVLRTYAHCGAEPFSYTAWVNAVRSGRTFVSAGPADFAFKVNGVIPGEETPPNGGLLRISAAVRGVEESDRLEVLLNGAVITATPGSASEMDFAAPAGGWLAARCWSGGRLLAHTSPVYVIPGRASPAIDPTAVSFLDQHLARAREWVETQGRFTKPKSREHLLGTFDAARQALLARLRLSGTIHGT
ncbi:MAG TPA: CehA/McbA family metallohydrolase [Gemmataceae bacterium]|jgi:hypothetical protein|nr:CehA/McbA family metallohydrolase [Gemmataceae bacterium]